MDALPSPYACLELGWEGKGRLGEGVGRACIVRVLCVSIVYFFVILLQ